MDCHARAYDENGRIYRAKCRSQLHDALVAAVNFNIFHHHADRVRLANVAQIVNVLQSMILTQGSQMLLTPTYHAFHMYIAFQESTSPPVDLETPPYSLGRTTVPALSISAARTAAGAIAIALLNLDSNRATPVSVRMVGARVLHANAEGLSAPAMDAHNTFDSPNSVHPMPLKGASLSGDTLSLTLPAKSVVVVNLQ